MSLLDKIESPQDIRALSLKELEQVAKELRTLIIKTVSRTGGHLASSLGTVELSIALHYVFDTPHDKLVWDVSHQCYAHKILTGRGARFHTLRQLEGISGFTHPEESEYDLFRTGHASTSIAMALGMARARDLQQENYKIVAIMGDGGLTGGLAYEALNNLGQAGTDLVIILNDNEMSISPSVGAISRVLNRLIINSFYNVAKEDLEELVRRLAPIGDKVVRLSHRVEEGIKGVLLPGTFFEEMGVRYLGPIDGHDVSRLVNTLRRVKDLRGPILVHAVTRKGKGYRPAEEDPESFHGASPFELATGKPKAGKTAFTDVFSRALCELARQDERVVALTAAMPQGTGLWRFAQEFPQRFFDVGIAEGSAVSIAAGLARAGLRPVVAIYSTFLQRAFDQLIHDVALQSLPVIFVLDRAGNVGQDGPTHHGAFDLSYLRLIPNFVVMAPADAQQLHDMLWTARKYGEGPVAIRFPRGSCPKPDQVTAPQLLPIGKGRIALKGKDVALFTLGKFLHHALDAASLLHKQEIYPTVVDLRFLKPLDVELIKEVAESHQTLFSLEDNTIVGGLGSAINETLASLELNERKCHILGWDDKFIEHGPPDELFARYQLDPEGIAHRILTTLNAKSPLFTSHNPHSE